jgi:hypothetical protein
MCVAPTRTILYSPCTIRVLYNTCCKHSIAYRTGTAPQGHRNRPLPIDAVLWYPVSVMGGMDDCRTRVMEEHCAGAEKVTSNVDAPSFEPNSCHWGK